MRKINILSVAVLCLCGFSTTEYNLNDKIEDVGEIKNQGILEDYSLIYNKYQSTFDSLIKNNLGWEPKSIEFAKEMDIVNSNKERALYIDFESENGFLVFNEDNVFKFEQSGDLLELRYLSDFSFSLVDNFVLYNDEQERYEKIYSDEFNDIICTESLIPKSPVVYNGQLKNGDGFIYDISSYVSDRYPNYKFVKSNYLKGYEWVSQFDTSVYTINSYKEGDSHASYYASEGNCTINATYSMLSNLPTVKNYNGKMWRYNQSILAGLNPMDYSNAVYADRQYASYGNKVLKNSYYDETKKANYFEYSEVNPLTNVYGKKTIKNMPTLYMQLRNIGIDKGYKPDEGLAISAAETMIEGVNSLYGNNIDMVKSTSNESVVSNLDYGIPSIISTNGSESFSNHAMAVYGYALYSYKKNVMWWTETHYAYFWMVDSGHGPFSNSLFVDSSGNKINWFDPNQSKISFIIANRNSLVWPAC